MNFLKIDKKLCVGCMKCVKDCIAGVLENGGGTPRVAQGGADRCIHCRHCMMICPNGALSIDGVAPDRCIPAEKIPSPESELALMRQRRSIRNYQQKNVSPETVNALLDAMRYVPTGVNCRGLFFSVIDDKVRMDSFRTRLNGKVLALFDGDPSAKQRFAHLVPVYERIKAGGDPVFRTAPHALFVSVRSDSACLKVDPFIALSYFELLAQTHGVGTCWCGWLYLVLTQLVPEMIPELGIPKGYELSYSMLFGYPAVGYARSGSPAPVPFVRI